MKFRPLHDRVVVKRIDAEEKSAGGIIIPDTAKEKPSEGEIIAVGPGGRDENGKLIPIDLKTGDRVLFGKWSGTEVKIDLFLHQQGLDTTTPAGKAMFQMMGVFAEFERAMIQERVRAGLARARDEGKRPGRPPIVPALEKRIREALATPGRPGVRVIAKQFGVNPGTVQRISRPFEQDAVVL